MTTSFSFLIYYPLVRDKFPDSAADNLNFPLNNDIAK